MWGYFKVNVLALGWQAKKAAKVEGEEAVAKPAKPKAFRAVPSSS